MKRSNLTKLTTNEAYLEECMKVLSLKVSATGMYICDKKENSLPQYFVNVESDSHQTISIVGGKYGKRVRFDGTNYIIDFRLSKNGDFVVYNQELGVRYCCSDEKLDDNIHIKTVYRISGDEQEFYKYLYSDGKCIILEHKANNEDGKTIITNEEVKDFTAEELIEYTNEYCSSCREIDEEVEEELSKLGIDNFGRDTAEQDEEWDKITEERVNSIIEACSEGEFTKENYDTINFISSDGATVNDEGAFICILPEDVHQFDYQKYRSNKNCGMDYCIREDCKREEDEALEDEYIEDEELDDEYSEELEAIAEVCIAGEEYGITDVEDYTVVINGETINEEEYKEDIIDEVTNNAMDLQLEVDFYRDNYEELSQEFDIIKSIISRRKRNMEEQKNPIESSTPSDKNDMRQDL